MMNGHARKPVTWFSFCLLVTHKPGTVGSFLLPGPKSTGIWGKNHLQNAGSPSVYSVNPPLFSPFPNESPFQKILGHKLALQLSSTDLDFVKADDGDALQQLFSKTCDKEGLMTKAAVMEIPAIAQLLVSTNIL